jgi:hypothetical protein
MAWIAVVPPSPRHPHERYQVRYQDGKRQRSAGIFPTKRRALAEQRAIEHARSGGLVADRLGLADGKAGGLVEVGRVTASGSGRALARSWSVGCRGDS